MLSIDLVLYLNFNDLDLTDRGEPFQVLKGPRNTRSYSVIVLMVNVILVKDGIFNYLEIIFQSQTLPLLSIPP